MHYIENTLLSGEVPDLYGESITELLEDVESLEEHDEQHEENWDQIEQVRLHV